MTRPPPTIRREPLPKVWPESHRDLVVLDDEFTTRVAPDRFTTLRMRFLVFKSQPAMRKFGKDVLGITNGLCRRTTGFCKDLMDELTWKAPGPPPCPSPHTSVDARYFAVVGMTVQNLTFEIISHEATHAAFALHRRLARRGLDSKALPPDALPEEFICYPVGHLTGAMIHSVRKNLRKAE